MTPALRSARLQLRPLGQADRTLYVALYGDAEVMRHIGPPLAPAAAEAAFDRLLAESAPQQLWVIDDGESCGLIGLRPAAPRRAEIGFLLCADKRRRGYIEEAIRLLTDHALATRQLEGMVVRHHPANHAVAQLMRKLGFHPDQRDQPDAAECCWERLRAAGGGCGASA